MKVESNKDSKNLKLNDEIFRRLRHAKISKQLNSTQGLEAREHTKGKPWHEPYSEIVVV